MSRATPVVRFVIFTEALAIPAPFCYSTTTVTKPLLVCAEVETPSTRTTRRVNRISNLFILRNSFVPAPISRRLFALRVLGGCLIAWGANEFGFTSSPVLAPNFRSTSESNRIKTNREGASDVPAKGTSGSGPFVTHTARFVPSVVDEFGFLFLRDCVEWIAYSGRAAGSSQRFQSFVGLMVDPTL